MSFKRLCAKISLSIYTFRRNYSSFNLVASGLWICEGYNIYFRRVACDVIMMIQSEEHGTRTTRSLHVDQE